MKSKKILVLIASALLLLTLFAGSATLAMLSNQTNTKENTFTDANPSTDIVENSSETPDSSNVIPTDGNGAEKQVSIQNTGDIPLYIRVMLIPGWKTEDGTAQAGDLEFGAEVVFAENSMIMGDLTMELAPDWREHWLYDEETRYFYYKTSVAPGEATTLLLEKVLLPEDKATQADWDNLQVEVLTDTLQSEGNALEVWPAVKLADGKLVLA